MFGNVEREPLPARAQVGPGRDDVAGDHQSPFGPEKSEVARRVAGRMHDSQRAHLGAFRENLVDRAGWMFVQAQVQPELERVGAHGVHGRPANAWRAAAPVDNARLPLVRIHRRPTELLQDRQPPRCERCA